MRAYPGYFRGLMVDHFIYFIKTGARLKGRFDTGSVRQHKTYDKLNPFYIETWKFKDDIEIVFGFKLVINEYSIVVYGL